MEGKIPGKEHREKTVKQRIPQRRTRCGLPSCPSDSKDSRIEEKEARGVTVDLSAIREDGTNEGAQEWL